MARHARYEEHRQLDHVKQDLLREFPALSPALVDQAFAHVVSGFERAPVRSFVPVLAQRATRARLRELTRT